MPSASTDTMIKMMENLPEGSQDRVVEHLREYIEDIKEEMKWAELFLKSQNKLVAAAKNARKEISEGKSVPLNLESL
ncbi:hypothetical protein QUF75_14765 [Desulfococcaceae bacterium HSG7]|nr:hypothetical protein [Desulfococcaceae bacterium HSG7]